MARGKIIYKVEWEKEGRKVEVPVRLFKKKGYDVDSDREHTLRAQYEEAEINVSGTDLEVIRKQVEEKLDAWFSITWKLWILVQVTGHRSDDDNDSPEASLKLEYEYIAVGTHSDDTLVHMRVPQPEELTDDCAWNGHRYAGHSQIKGMPETGTERKMRWHGGPRDGDEETRALIPATPENKAALDRFRDAMTVLRDKMHEHFHPDKIESLLASPGLILPAPKKKKGD